MVSPSFSSFSSSSSSEEEEEEELESELLSELELLPEESSISWGGTLGEEEEREGEKREVIFSVKSEDEKSGVSLVLATKLEKQVYHNL